MAITKVSRGLLNTGISDSSDATAITISSNENVLIGSTAEIASNIGLQVTGTDAAGFISLFRDDSSIVANDDLGGILFYGDDNSATTQFAYMRATAEGTHADGDNPTAIRFGTTADGTEAPTERMRIDGSGNLGIGTTSPTRPLHINSSEGRLIRLTHASKPKIEFVDTTNGTSGAYISSEDNELMFETSGQNERMRITSAGQVFVGTTSSVDAGQFIVSADPSTYNHITTIPEANAAYNALTMTNSSGTRLGAITVGTSGSTAITYGNSSDYRLKENIVPMEKGLERVKKLKPVQFNWKDDGFSSEGFIAHEIQEAGWVLGVTGEKDAEEMQMVDYGRITPLLVKAIQEQQEQIEALQSEINTLKGG